MTSGGEARDQLQVRFERLNREIAAHHAELGKTLQQARELREALRNAEELKRRALIEQGQGAAESPERDRDRPSQQ